MEHTEFIFFNFPRQSGKTRIINQICGNNTKNISVIAKNRERLRYIDNDRNLSFSVGELQYLHHSRLKPCDTLIIDEYFSMDEPKLNEHIKKFIKDAHINYVLCFSTSNHIFPPNIIEFIHKYKYEQQTLSNKLALKCVIDSYEHTHYFNTSLITCKNVTIFDKGSCSYEIENKLRSIGIEYHHYGLLNFTKERYEAFKTRINMYNFMCEIDGIWSLDQLPKFDMYEYTTDPDLSRNVLAVSFTNDMCFIFDNNLKTIHEGFERYGETLTPEMIDILLEKNIIRRANLSPYLPYTIKFECFNNLRNYVTLQHIACSPKN